MQLRNRENFVKLLSELLAEGVILCPLEETEKWAAIEECVQALPHVASRKIDFASAMAAIREREAQEHSTILDNGVAIPYGILPDPAPLAGALGVSPVGVSYGVGARKAGLIFVIVGSRSVRREYLGILAQIARLFRGLDLKNKIMQAKLPGDVLQLIRDAENS